MGECIIAHRANVRGSWLCGDWYCVGDISREVIITTAEAVAITLIFFFIIGFSFRCKKMTTVIEISFLKTMVIIAL